MAYAKRTSACHGHSGPKNSWVLLALATWACGASGNGVEGASGATGANAGGSSSSLGGMGAVTTGGSESGGSAANLDGGVLPGIGGTSGGAGGASGQNAGGAGNSGTCTAAGVAVPAAERVSNGNPLLPPKWAFGVLWGSYYDQNGTFVDSSGNHGNILDAAAKVRAEYSGDLFWIDSSWLWHDYANPTEAAPRYICFQFDPTAFPDPGAMIATLRQSHFHFGVWQWPWMDHGCQLFNEAVSNKYFIMNGTQPALLNGDGWHGDPNPAEFDFTRPAAVTWWLAQNKPLTDWGLDFLKLDTTGGSQTSPVSKGGGTLADPSKDYVHERNRAAYEATKVYAAAHDPSAMLNGARGFIMPKAPSPANDQLPGWWTNDTTSSFPGLVEEMGRAAKLNTTKTAAYWGGDTGGYNHTPTDELYIRWLEYTAFTPLQEFFAAKTTGYGARFPWLFGTQAQQLQKQYTALRYRLLPFRYSNALAAYEKPKPVAYPVTWIGSTQLLVGSGSSQLLVQPVTTAGLVTASVDLPAGSSWIHYFTGKSYEGGKTVSVPAPLDQEPIFVRAGAIIPMGPPLRYVDEVPADPLTLDIYPAGTTSYTLYEDDGVSEGYLGGAYATTKFTSTASSGNLVVGIGAQATAKYGYTGQLCSRTYILKLNGQAAAPKQVTRDGSPSMQVAANSFDAAAEGWYYDAATQTVWVKFRLASSAQTSVSVSD